MPDASQKPADYQRPAKHRALAPVICALLLLAAVAAVLWNAWRQSDIHAEKNAEQQASVAKLARERDELKRLLQLPPCEAKKELEKKTSAKPAASGSAPAASLKAGKTSHFVDDIEKACVFLVTTDGSRIVTGSGFFVAPGYIVTNRHVVANGNGRALATSHALGKAARVQVVAMGQGADADFALLSLDAPRTQTAVLPFAKNVKKTDRVGAWGFPDIVGKNDPAYGKLLRGEDIASVPELSYTEGVVSAVLPRNPEIIVHTAPISPGNSGGPLLNENGELVGINTMITLDESSYRQASLALGANALKTFLASQGIAIDQRR